MQLKMALSIEQVLADAQMLVGRLKEHDSSADNLISTTQTMYRRIDSMKQYEAGLSQLNEMGRHRPRSNLILALVKENNQIRELQQENKELRSCLEEHQSAIELIMSKYREQVVKLLLHKKLDQSTEEKPMSSDRVQVDKICEMVAVMQKAASIDESNGNALRLRLAQLETENKTLRELLKISYKHSRELTHIDRNIQVDMLPPIVLPTVTPVVADTSTDNSIYQPSVAEDSHDDEDSHFVTNDAMNSSVIEQSECVADINNTSLSTPVITDTDTDCACGLDSATSAQESTESHSNCNTSNSTVTDLTSCSNTKAFDIDTTIISDDSNDTTIMEAHAADITITESHSQLHQHQHAEGDGLNIKQDVNNTEVLCDNEVSIKSLSDQTGEPATAAGSSPGAEIGHSQAAAEDERASPSHAESLTPTKKSAKHSGRKSGGGKAAVATIKRGKGKSILQDMNANTGFDNKDSETPLSPNKQANVT